MADSVLAYLRKVYFYVMLVQSAPAAGQFSRISGSIIGLSTNPRLHAKVSALEVFKIPKAVLRGLEGNRDVRMAVQRLTDTLASNAEIPGLVTSILEEPTERLQSSM